MPRYFTIIKLLLLSLSAIEPLSHEERDMHINNQ